LASQNPVEDSTEDSPEKSRGNIALDGEQVSCDNITV
jgi:hypothetical protein